MLILLMSVLPNILENFQCELICQFRIGGNLRYYKVNDLCSSLTNDACIALPFFHAFTGCDTTLSFYNHSKLKFFDVWMKYNKKDDVTNLFKELCNEPLRITANHLNILEKFVQSVYYPKRSSFKSIDHESMDAFNATPNSNLRLIPFSRKGLKEHTKRACLQSGWLWKEGEKNVASQDTLERGWKMKKTGLFRNGNLMKISRPLKYQNLLLFNYI